MRKTSPRSLLPLWMALDLGRIDDRVIFLVTGEMTEINVSRY